MIFEVRRLQTEIYLKAGNRSRADQGIQAMAKMMEDREVYDRRSNYRAFLETKSHYLVETGQYADAKELFNDTAYFTREERDKAIRDIEVIQAFATKRKH